MTYRQTIDFLFHSLPMFQRIGNAAIKKDLTNIKALCELLGHPEIDYPSIHIAGTNGKGSTSHMLASVFQAAGKKVGLYTSPHYIDFRERIKINGEPISKHNVIKFVERFKNEWEPIKPSFFEITLAMAFDHFRKHKVEIAIIETGLGGRLDSTNIIQPLLSVITNIGFDHMQMLGNTLSEIAAEKAGIIKQRMPVVIGEWHKESSKVFRQKAIEMKAPITFASQQIAIVEKAGNELNKVYHIESKSGQINREIKCDLAGAYQSKNIGTVVQALLTWNQYYPHENVSLRAIIAGLKNVKERTGMIGRWMVLNRKPLVITDAAHNVDGIKNIIPAIKNIPALKKHFVLGFVSDKDVVKVLRLFPKDGIYYWCMPDLPRGKPVSETFSAGMELGLQGEAYESVQAAYKSALSHAGKNDFVFVGGSSYVVGELLSGMKTVRALATSSGWSAVARG